MACFLAPVAEAIVVSIVKHNIKKKEEIALEAPKAEIAMSGDSGKKIPLSQKLGWLNKLLWGGSFLLLFEHIWHGEIVFYFPFFTAMQNKADAIEMLKEIATVGVTMAALCTIIWCCMLAISGAAEAKRAKAKKSKSEGAE
ncbi:MAG: hypothetical protein LUH82_02175 [Clostridiales bacterium]|nr:hypothetical protein [Clostridiales bacterium]